MNLLYKLYPFIILFLICIIFCYITLIYPKQQLYIHQKNIEKDLKINTIVLINGIIGKVIKIQNTPYLTILINKDTQILIHKKYISKILPDNIFNKL